MKKVLLLENDQGFGETVRDFLVLRGFTVEFINTTGMTVSKALSEAGKRACDVVLTDCRWDDTDDRDVSGVAFIRQWRGKAILMSSEAPSNYHGRFVGKDVIQIAAVLEAV